MSLGAFLTDESKIAALWQPCSNTDRSQKWDLGLMRWRTCQFVSVNFCPPEIAFANTIFHSWYEFALQANMNTSEKYLGTDYSRLPYLLWNGAPNIQL